MIKMYKIAPNGKLIYLGVPKFRQFTVVVICLGIGRPKIMFFFVLNRKLIILGVPIFRHFTVMVMCPNIGTPKIINFSIVPNGYLTILDVPKFRHSTSTFEHAFSGLWWVEDFYVQIWVISIWMWCWIFWGSGVLPNMKMLTLFWW